MEDRIQQSNRRIVKNTTFLYIRMIISLCISLYTSRAILEALGVEDYGIYNVVAGFVSMLSLFTGTITSACQRFITFEIGAGNTNKLQDTFSTFVNLLIVLGIVILIVGELIGYAALNKYLVIPPERFDAALFVFHCSLLTFVINLISLPYTATILAYEHINFFAILSIGESVFRLIAVLLLLYVLSCDNLKCFAFMLVVIAVILRGVNGIYCSKMFKSITHQWLINKEILKRVFTYSFWVTIGASSAILKEQGVNVIINIFFGVLLNAARGVSMQVYGVVSQFANNIGTAVTPQITKSYASGDVNRSIKLTFLLAKSQGLLLFIVSLPLILETEYILGIWLKEVPASACLFTRWALILCLARTLENTHGPLFLATGNVRNLQIVGGGVMLLNVPLCYAAFKLGFEPISSMIIGVILEILVMFVAFVFLKKMVGFPLVEFYTKVILPFFSVIFLSSIIPGYVRFYLMEESFIRLLIVGILSVMCSLILSWYIVLNNNEKSMLLTMVKSKLKKS